MEILALEHKIDVETKLEREGLVFLDVMKPPFKIHGLMYENGGFCRIPAAVAENVSENVAGLATCTSGGRIRFRLKNADWFAIHIESADNDTKGWTISPVSGMKGVDVYANNEFTRIDFPYDPYEYMFSYYTSTLDDEITINLPLHRGIFKIYIGVPENAIIAEPREYSLKKPIVFYGSSITQGMCASRPGMTYEEQLSRRLDFDYVNLGFSGSAKAEDAIAEYISRLDMSIFVYDYDHNAPSHEYLAQTHEKMFMKIREANPTLPILMLSRPRPKSAISNSDVAGRQAIVRKTYENALAVGDKNVYFLPGTELIRDEIGNDWSVCGVHPTDLGFFSMATAIEPVLKSIIDTLPKTSEYFSIERK